MDSSVFLEVKERVFTSSSSSPELQPYFLGMHEPPPYIQSNGFYLENKVSPSVLLIIVILAIVFFVSGLLHLLVRFLWTPPMPRDPESIIDNNNVTAFQGQLQQLFHLHDSGVDQSFIDTLPVFHYKDIIGSKNPFDCSVCLCEFEPDDKLRLLPKCSHAFHTDCIDTWLLSHSTCPLCRSSLLPDHFSPSSSCAPIVLVLESGSQRHSFRDIVPDREIAICRTNSQMGPSRACEIIDMGSSETETFDDANETVVTVKLGKYKNVDAGEGGMSGENNNVESISRRCFSMGSFEYVMDENSSLKVAIRNTPVKKQPSKKLALPSTPGYRPAMSECDCESRREFNFKLSGFEPFRDLKTSENVNLNSNKIEKTKIESFSVSKIWLREKKQSESSSSIDSTRRAVSFRFPFQWNGTNPRPISEIDIYRWRNQVSIRDEENERRNSLDSQSNQSFTKKTLSWLMGRQNKVTDFHSSSSPSNI